MISNEEMQRAIAIDRLERQIAETQAEIDRLERELFTTERLIRVALGALCILVPLLILALIFV